MRAFVRCPFTLNKAIELYRKSAEQGNEDAQFRLGTMYLFGFGVTQDFKKARECFKTAADQGHEEAKKALQDMFKSGKT